MSPISKGKAEALHTILRSRQSVQYEQQSNKYLVCLTSTGLVHADMHCAFLPCIRKNFLYKPAFLLLYFNQPLLDLRRTMKLCILLGISLVALGGGAQWVMGFQIRGMDSLYLPNPFSAIVEILLFITFFKNVFPKNRLLSKSLNKTLTAWCMRLLLKFCSNF